MCRQCRTTTLHRLPRHSSQQEAQRLLLQLPLHLMLQQLLAVRPCTCLMSGTSHISCEVHEVC